MPAVANPSAPVVRSAHPLIEQVAIDGRFGTLRLEDGDRPLTLVTHDGGRTFQDVRIPGGARTGAQLLAGGLGYAVGDAGRLRVTADGGRRWRVAPIGRVQSFAATSTGAWAITRNRHGRAGLARTADGGRHWSVDRLRGLGSSTGPFDAALAFADAADGALSGFDARGRPVLRITRDGGRTWQSRQVPCTRAYLHAKGGLDVSWLVSGALWLTCRSGGAAGAAEVFRSDDAAATFRFRARTGVFEGRPPHDRAVPTANGLPGGRSTELLAVSDREALIGGQARGLSRTQDGGRSWHKLPGSKRFEQTWDLHADDQIRWAAYGNDGLWQSSDSGRNWHRVRLRVRR